MPGHMNGHSYHTRSPQAPEFRLFFKYKVIGAAHDRPSICYMEGEAQRRCRAAAGCTGAQSILWRDDGHAGMRPSDPPAHVVLERV